MPIDVSIFPVNGVEHFLKGFGLESSQKTHPTPLSKHTTILVDQTVHYIVHSSFVDWLNSLAPTDLGQN